MKNEDLLKCGACGSSRVVPGSIAGEGGAWFEVSEVERLRYWTTLSGTTTGVDIHQEPGVRACLDCGAVMASLTVDVQKLRKVIDKWGTDALKSRLRAGDAAA